MRPDLGHIEDVPAKRFGVFWIKDLDVKGPRGVLATSYSVEEILRVPVRIRCSKMSSLFEIQGLVALVADEVHLDVFEAPVCSDELERMARVCVHVPIGQRRSSVGEELYDLMNGFLIACQEVPEHGSIFGILSRSL